jgi:hypothetical protein
MNGATHKREEYQRREAERGGDLAGVKRGRESFNHYDIGFSRRRLVLVVGGGVGERAKR